MSVINTIKKVATSGRIPYTYKVGEPAGKPMPFDVKLSIDPDFKKTIIKGITIFSGGLALGIFAGFVFTSKSKNKK
jgi:hypothetical protein